jgi:putative redox protein
MKIREPYKKIPKVVEATLEWNGHMGFTCKSGSGHEVQIDASPGHGGDDSGARPMEFLLFALTGCTGMDVTMFLKKKHRDLQRLQIKTHGQRAATHPHVYEAITLEYILTGSDLTDDDIRWAIDLSLKKYCSVAGMIGKICKLSYRWKINKSAPGTAK